MVRFSFAFRELHQKRGLFDGLFEGGFALLLHFAEHLEVIFHAALDAVRVETEELQLMAVGEPDAGLGEGDVDFGSARGVFAGLADAEGEDV
ncbi:MAG: hypothetical protein ACLPX8_00905, partial [Bryobacteraceae bacterium]